MNKEDRMNLREVVMAIDLFRSGEEKEALELRDGDKKRYLGKGGSGSSALICGII